ncbi:MAG: hypothetical protein FJ387_11805 [Verrucomicrobia bacterium]|nr:hypothetical protein [Verrucomicrobiota bacterium]
MTQTFTRNRGRDLLGAVMRTGWLLVALALANWTTTAAGDSASEGLRIEALRPASGGRPGFSLVDPERTGIAFTNVLQGDAYLTNVVAHNGSGVAVGDLDGDGWQDLYFCGLQGPNRLYRNLGNWRFAEVAPGEAACAGQLSTGATFADVDGNGTLDLLVNGIGTGTRLFLNDGQGRLAERVEAGLSRTASATSLALADIDGDGDLDLYCTHYNDAMLLWDRTIKFALAKRGDQWVVTKVNGESTQLPRWKDRFEALPDGSVRELPEYDGFYRNDGQGRFAPILFAPGLFADETGQPAGPYRDWGLSVMFRDLNGDGAPDFYVCNDNASPDRLWINTGRGTFTALPGWKLRHTSRSSMGLDFADVNRDGRDDLLVLDMLAREHLKRMTQLVRDRPDLRECERSEAQPRYNRNTLFLGREDGSYAEVALLAGVAATGWSWCPMFLDVDLDGYEDLLVTTGFGMDVMDQDSHDQMPMRLRQMTLEQRQRARQLHPAWPTASLAYRNRGDGTFELASSWGFDRVGIANGAALGDLDNDGDLDVVVNHLNAVAAVYRNDTPAARIAVRLQGLPPNTQGIGARVSLSTPTLTQSQEMICGGRYASSDQALRVFAAPTDSSAPLRLEVRWRNGARSVVPGVEANRLYEVRQPTHAAAAPAAPGPAPAPLFADLSALIGHVHTEAPFDDWARQPMLPRRLSGLGPGVSWCDLNGDGWEDLLIGAGRGGRLAVFLNEQGRAFRGADGGMPSVGDQGAILNWPDGRGNRYLLVATSNYESARPRDSLILAAPITNLASAQFWPAGHASLGPMALADVDSDGDLDLFVGGRTAPGRYPAPVASAIWLNEQGKLAPGGRINEAFRAAGLVSGATFVDVDIDGDADLVLATEWGPVRLFLDRGDRYEEATEPWGLAELTGWWTSVAAGDFDGDGRPDLACGNWGRNSIYELYQPTALRVVYDDWDGDNVLELIEAWQSDGQWLPLRDRTWLARGWPEWVGRFPTHRSFAQATVDELLPENQRNNPHLEATYLASAVFLNRGSRFEPVPLPQEAQLAPVFAVNVGDFDGDGLEDLFLGQNFFGSASDLSRDDGGLGLWLRGTGGGQFEPMSVSRSGLRILGEQRGAALADFNHDGRLDLAVSQNGGPTKLYLNREGKPGLRVSLRGSPANPDAVGAQMRVVYAGERRGPGRFLQAGSGYWSQDASTQVLGLQADPVALWVRWPNGQEQTVPLEPGAATVQVDFEP